MSTVLARELALDIAERIGGADEVTVKRFFGGAALVAVGLQFGFVMKGSLYLHTDDIAPLLKQWVRRRSDMPERGGL